MKAIQRDQKLKLMLLLVAVMLAKPLEAGAQESGPNMVQQPSAPNMVPVEQANQMPPFAPNAEPNERPFSYPEDVPQLSEPESRPQFYGYTRPANEPPANGQYYGQSPYWYYRSMSQAARGYNYPSYHSCSPSGSYPSTGYSFRPRYATAPAGLVIPITLATAISTDVARPGDYVQATVSQNVHLQGLSYIPAGSTVSGEISEAEPGRRFDRSGMLSMNFDKLNIAGGPSVPIDAHLLGKIGKYNEKNGVVHGEGWGAKLGGLLVRGAIGAGSGALFGTAVGGITGYVGTGAWAGTAIGGGVGLLDGLMFRKGRNVIINNGTPMQLQLAEPLEIPLNGQMGAS